MPLDLYSTSPPAKSNPFKLRTGSQKRVKIICIGTEKAAFTSIRTSVLVGKYNRHFYTLPDHTCRNRPSPQTFPTSPPAPSLPPSSLQLQDISVGVIMATKSKMRDV